MRYTRRSIHAPAVLIKRDDNGYKELVKARTFFGKRRRSRYPAKNFKAYKDDAVKAALYKLFHSKCAYCESFFASTAPVDVEHFRPKARVKEDIGHPGYWWLAMKWQNLLPSCIDCNRSRKQIAVAPGGARTRRRATQAARAPSGKADSFPTANGIWIRLEKSVAAEKPLLLNPTIDRPERHLRWVVDDDFAMVVPATVNGREDPRGRTSIDVFGLNRQGLVQARTRAMRELRLKRDKIMRLIRRAGRTTDRATARDLIADAQEYATELRQACRPAEPYSALARAFVANFERELRSALRGEHGRSGRR